MKDLFAKLRIKNHLTAAGIRKCEGYSLLACLLEHDEQSQTIGDLFRQLEEETGKITFLERLRQYLSPHLGRIFDTLAHFMIHPPRFGLVSTLSPVLSMSFPYFRGAKDESICFVTGVPGAGKTLAGLHNCISNPVVLSPF
jgi:hypothetical protein